MATDRSDRSASWSDQAPNAVRAWRDRLIPVVSASAFGFLLFSLSWLIANLLHEGGHLLATVLLNGGLQGESISFGLLGGQVKNGLPTGWRYDVSIMSGILAPIVIGLAMLLVTRRRAHPIASALAGTVAAAAILQIGLVLLLSSVMRRLRSADLRTLFEAAGLGTWPAQWALAGIALTLGAAALMWALLRACAPARSSEHHSRALVVASVGGALAVPVFIWTLRQWEAIGALFAKAHDVHTGVIVLGTHLAFCVVASLGWVVGWTARSRAVGRLSLAYLIVMNLGHITYHNALAIGESNSVSWSPEAAAAKGDPFAQAIVTGERFEEDGQFADAAREWTRAYKASPSQAYLAVRLGRALYLAGEGERATRVLEHALDESVASRLDISRIHHWLGRIALDRGDTSAACEHFRKQLFYEVLPPGNDSLAEAAKPFMATMPDCREE